MALAESTPALEQRLREPGEHEVDSAIVCVITRFGLRSVPQLLTTYRDYRRVVRDACSSKTPGLLRSAFLVEGPKTCYSLSVWAERGSIPWFGTSVPSHVEAANKVFGRLSGDPERGPELWSTKWRLIAVSNNLNWDNFDLRRLLTRVDA